MGFIGGENGTDVPNGMPTLIVKGESETSRQKRLKDNA